MITQEILFEKSAAFGGKGYFAVDGTRMTKIESVLRMMQIPKEDIGVSASFEIINIVVMFDIRKHLWTRRHVTN